jgi:hypothetical protein
MAQAKLTLIWVFGGDDHGADMLWVPKFMPKDRGIGSHVPLISEDSFERADRASVTSIG